MTINLSQTSLQPPQFGHGALATARLPFVANNDTAGLASAAASVGMTQVAANQFQHPIDGSWAVMNGNRVERGVGQIHFRGVPADLMRIQTAMNAATCAAHAIAPTLPAASIVAPLIAAGFAETSKNFFVHADGSWVAVTPDAGVIRGQNQSQFPANDVRTGSAQGAAPARPARPAPGAATFDVMALPQRSPAFEDGFLACAMPGRLDPQQASTEAAGLLQQGFVQTHPGYFEHPTDKSWVAFTAQNTVERGPAGARFDRVPTNPTRLGQINPRGHDFALSAANPSLQTMTFAQVQKSDAALVAAGFTRAAGVHAVYSHPDGCFFAYTPNQTYVRAQPAGVLDAAATA
jgi:hypothetical protein